MADNLHVTEAKSQRELAETVISPGTAKFLSIAFIALITLPAVFQVAAELRTGTVLHEFRTLTGPPTRVKLRAFEQELDNASIFRNYFQPRVQAILSGPGGFGNEKVTLSRKGWLYYAPGLRYVYGEPFLDADFLKMRTKNMVNKEVEAEPNPDPRPALFDLVEDCRKRGIRLLLIPTPDKGMLQASQLTERAWDTASPPNNPSFSEFAAELRNRGADVFEVAPRQVQANEALYLKQDTHWGPRFMEESAALVANHVLSMGVLPAPSAIPRFRLLTSTQSSFGDLVGMLKLPPSQAEFPKETVVLHRVIDNETGQPAAAAPGAPLLLLGDSFTNIFSLASLNWGEGSGFAEHLAYRLNQPIDVITMNGGGASGIRVELIRAAMQGRLEGKTLVVYQFAIRNLAVENWKRMRLPDPARTKGLLAADAGHPSSPKTIAGHLANQQACVREGTSRTSTSPPTPKAAAADLSDGAIRLVGKVLKLSTMPVPGVSPYRDCLNMVQMQVETVVTGKYQDRVMLVAFEVMRDNVLTDNARLRPGDRLELEVRLLRNAEDRFQTMQRSDDLDDFEHRPFLVLSSKPL